MNNHVILIGRLTRNPELQLTDSGKKISTITLAVPRSYKNIDGEYDTDFIDCVLWTGIAENTAEYCKTGDIVGIRGRIQTRIIENDDGSKYKRMEVVVDKVSFLTAAKKDKTIEKEEENNIKDGNNDDKSAKKKK